MILLKSKPDYATLLFQKTESLGGLQGLHSIHLTPLHLRLLFSWFLACLWIPPSALLPQGLCTCFSLCLECSLPQIPMQFSSLLLSGLNSDIILSGRLSSIFLYQREVFLSLLFTFLLWAHHHISYYIFLDFFGLAPALKCKVGKKTTDYFATVLSAFRPLKTFSRCSINGFSILKKPLPKGFSSNLSLLLFFLFMHQMGTLLISFLVWLWFLTFL